MKNRSTTQKFALVDKFIDILINPSRRISFLIAVAYASAISGLALSILGDVGDPSSVHTSLGIALMAVSFISLFVVSMAILDLIPEAHR